MNRNDLTLDDPAKVDTASPNDLAYRPDIDALRAVAVLSVVLFHLQTPFLDGGFVGVDIFFVISGFLITRIIAREIDGDNFTLKAFYERRIRRIIPALFVMLIITSMLAYATLIPQYYKAFSASAVAAALSAANIYFLFNSGYFAFGHEVVPLLHTWSLGVEEQFYIVIPVLFYILRSRFKLSWGLVIWPLFAASLLLCILQTYVDLKALLLLREIKEQSGSAAFYLPTTRSWEFLLGSALAIPLLPAVQDRRKSEIFILLGLSLICASVFFFNGQMRFPGVIAIVPTVGATLLIYGSSGSCTTFTGTILRWRPLVGLGLISYSLYLWHWPIIVFVRLFFGGELSLLSNTLVVVVMIAVSWLSWKFVERPIRTNRAYYTPARLLAASGTIAGIILFLGIAATVTGGIPARFSKDLLNIATSADTLDWRADCNRNAAAGDASDDVCSIGAGPLTFAVLGDSFVDALRPAIAEAARRTGVSGLSLNKGGCFPLPGVITRRECFDFLNAALARIEATPSVQNVLLIARWPAAVEGSRFGAIKLDKLFITDANSMGASYEENIAVFRRGLSRALELLAGRNIFVLAYVPEQVANVPQAAILQRLWRVGDFGTPRNIVEDRQARTKAILEELSQKFGFQILDAMPSLCDEKICRGTEGDVSLYSDDNHLSKAGALKELPLLLRALGSKKESP